MGEEIVELVVEQDVEIAAPEKKKRGRQPGSKREIVRKIPTGFEVPESFTGLVQAIVIVFDGEIDTTEKGLCHTSMIPLRKLAVQLLSKKLTTLPFDEAEFIAGQNIGPLYQYLLCFGEKEDTNRFEMASLLRVRPELSVLGHSKIGWNRITKALYEEHFGKPCLAK
jgi:hypothetical protein